MRSSFADLLADLGGVFGRLGVRWYLFGAQAALLHGASRLTADVDVTIHLGSRSVEELTHALGLGGFTLRVADPAFIERTRVVAILHTASGVAADVVLGGPGLEEEFLAHAELRDFEGVEVPVARAEDLVIMKCLAGRPKDLEDVVAILAARMTDVDTRRIVDTLRRIESALDQSDLVPAFEQAFARARRRIG